MKIAAGKDVYELKHKKTFQLSWAQVISGVERFWVKLRLCFAPCAASLRSKSIRFNMKMNFRILKNV